MVGLIRKETLAPCGLGPTTWLVPWSVCVTKIKRSLCVCWLSGSLEFDVTIGSSVEPIDARNVEPAKLLTVLQNKTQLILTHSGRRQPAHSSEAFRVNQKDVITSFLRFEIVTAPGIGGGDWFSSTSSQEDRAFDFCHAHERFRMRTAGASRRQSSSPLIKGDRQPGR